MHIILSQTYVLFLWILFVKYFSRSASMLLLLLCSHFARTHTQTVFSLSSELCQRLFVYTISCVAYACPSHIYLSIFCYCISMKVTKCICDSDIHRRRHINFQFRFRLRMSNVWFVVFNFVNCSFSPCGVFSQLISVNWMACTGIFYALFLEAECHCFKLHSLIFKFRI